MNNKVAGYLDGYMQKQAITAGAMKAGVEGTRLAADLGGQALLYIALAPVLLGAGGGTLHSRVTSPSDVDIATVQKALESAEAEEFLAEMQRRQSQEADQKDRENLLKEEKGARTLHV